MRLTSGIRRYLNRSSLLAHTDRVTSHVISAILNIGQQVEQPWPLNILDHRGGEHTVLLQPGQVSLTAHRLVGLVGCSDVKTTETEGRWYGTSPPG